MLYWPKLLTTAHGISASVEPYLPLYLYEFQDLNVFSVALLMACMGIGRLLNSTLLIWLVDTSAPKIQVLVMHVLTLSAAVAYVALFSIPTPLSMEIFVMALAIAAEAFFLPLSALLDSALIKYLGDYKVWLFDKQRRWGKMASSLSVALIGAVWYYDDQLSSVALIAAVCLGACMMVGALIPVQRTQGITPVVMEDDEENEDMLAQPPPRFLKNALFPQAFIAYKPYSLFGESLSHISEEDASMLRRMASNNTTTLMRRNSNHSVMSTATAATSTSALMASGSVPVTMYGTTTHQTWRRPSIMHPPPLTETMSSAEMALLPLPPRDTPMSVLLLKLSNGPLDQVVQWQIQSMSLSSLLLGVVQGMMNTLLFIYLYKVLDLPMWITALVGSVDILTSLFVRMAAPWWIPKFTATMSSAVVHAVLIICAFAYTWLRPDWPYVSGAAILLQTCQGIAFELIWLVITQLLGALLWTDEDQRITQVAKMSALYCGIGPALGALVVAFLVSSGEGNAAAELLLLQGFTLVFRCSVALTAASFVFSWGWSSSD